LDNLKELFISVSKPARYIGGEVNQIKKDPANIRLKFALCFPDIYEIGMSHIGGKIIYKMLNDQKDILCERVFAPWIDARDEMKKRGIRLFSLENRIPLNRFDIIGFSIQYEMSFSTIIDMLYLGGVEPLSIKREDSSPLLIAGGPSVFNPEPIARIFDLFYLGDAEQNLLHLLNRYIQLKEARKSRREILEILSEIEGVYIPSFFDIRYNHLYPINLPTKAIKKATIPVFSVNNYPERQILPLTEAVQDRFVVEIQRGCAHGCRFCFAGYIYRPVRQRDSNEIFNIVVDGINKSGFQDVSFLSLSVGDYYGLEHILKRLNDRFSSKKISLSLPSLRVDTASAELINQISRVKKTGITIAPEAGSERMRQKINKNISESDIIRAVETAFSKGWELIKLYFMIGLPEEIDEDIYAICDISYKILDVAKRYINRPDINITISPFIPKPHTPLQWDEMDDEENLKRKLHIIRKNLNHPAFKIKKVDFSLSIIESLLSRGDRRVLDIILAAHKNGSYLDSWTDHFDISFYKNAEEEFYKKYQIRILDYLGTREREKPLAWDIIDTGISKNFLLGERERYKNSITTEDCMNGVCSKCGICNSLIKNTKASNTISDVSGDIPEIEKGLKDQITYYRLQYSKENDMIYISHLDTMNIFTKALLMSGLPLIFRGKFNPRVELSFGPALPVGIISTTEFMDFALQSTYPVDGVIKILSQLLPSGIRIINIIQSLTRIRSISQAIAAARFDISTRELPDQKRIDEIISASELKIVRRRREKIKEVDIRKFIYDIKIDDETLKIYLLYREEGTANIFEVLSLLGIDNRNDIEIRKDKIYFSVNDL